MDSGAFKHMTFNKSLFSNLSPMSKPIMVILPNSYKMKVTHSGSVYLLSNLLLHNVLYIPSFKFNLLSIHKLCKQFQKFILFTPNTYFMLQDPSLKSPLVLGREQRGLYVFKSTQLTVFITSELVESTESLSRFSSNSFSFSNSVANVFTSYSSFFDSNIKEIR